MKDIYFCGKKLFYFGYAKILKVDPRGGGLGNRVLR